MSKQEKNQAKSLFETFIWRGKPIGEWTYAEILAVADEGMKAQAQNLLNGQSLHCVHTSACHFIWVTPPFAPTHPRRDRAG